MWRAVFAFTFVDSTLSLEEQELLQSYLSKVPFTTDQLATLRQDLIHPQKVEDLYGRVTDAKDKERFCVLCRAIVWCEGDMIHQEKMILQKLGCLKADLQSQFEQELEATRDHPSLHEYYKHYARSGMVGLLKSRPTVELRV